MAKIFRITDFGAVGDGVTNCTTAIQKAIDACSAAGGGTVLVEDGTYLYYPLILKSHVRLEITTGTTMLAGSDPALYPDVPPNPVWKVGYALRNNKHYVMYAESAEDITLCGGGTLNFNSWPFMNYDLNMPAGNHWPRKSDFDIPGRCLFFAGCKNLRLENLTLLDAPGWFTWFLNCEQIKVDGLTIYSDLRQPNADGLHFGSCRDVIVSNCNIHTGDDCIIIRSMQEQFDHPIPCENVVITNCILQSTTMAIRIGWTRDYEMRNCAISNLVIKDSNRGICVTCPAMNPNRPKDPPRYPDTPQPYPEDKPLAVENVSISNVEATTIYEPFAIFISDKEESSYIRNITLNNFRARSGRFPAIIAAEKHHVSDISFKGLDLIIRRGDFSDKIVMRDGKPTHTSLSTKGLIGEEGSSVNGFLLKHAQNVRFEDVSVKYE